MRSNRNDQTLNLPRCGFKGTVFSLKDAAYWRTGRSYKSLPGPRPTLGDLQRSSSWWWLHCERCQHNELTAFAAAVIWPPTPFPPTPPGPPVHQLFHSALDVFQHQHTDLARVAFAYAAPKLPSKLIVLSDHRADVWKPQHQIQSAGIRGDGYGANAASTARRLHSQPP
jgi:hypothetical protein